MADVGPYIGVGARGKWADGWTKSYETLLSFKLAVELRKLAIHS